MIIFHAAMTFFLRTQVAHALALSCWFAMQKLDSMMYCSVAALPMIFVLFFQEYDRKQDELIVVSTRRYGIMV
jgi:hypothetical protein